jgi:hypothetical protein
VRSFLLFLVAACGHAPCPTPSGSAPAKAVAALGDTFTLDSQLLGETRVINVYVPDKALWKDRETLTVLYMPDGGMKEDFPHVVGAVDVSIKNGQIEPIMVVGIENIERRKDLAGPTVVEAEKKMAPKAGGSDNFRRFIRDELKPAIAKRYPVGPTSAIIGESAAGLFVTETLIVDPTLFDFYIAVDPSVWWNEQHVVRQASVRFGSWTAGPKRFYVAHSSEGDESGMQQLTSALRIQQPPIAWKHEPMLDERHITIYPRAALGGIRWMFEAPGKP